MSRLMISISEPREYAGYGLSIEWEDFVSAVEQHINNDIDEMILDEARNIKLKELWRHYHDKLPSFSVHSIVSDLLSKRIVRERTGLHERELRKL